MIDRVLVFGMNLFLCVMIYLMFFGSEGDMYFGLLALMSYGLLQPIESFVLRSKAKSLGRYFVAMNMTYWSLSILCLLAIYLTVFHFNLRFGAGMADIIFFFFPLGIAVYQQVNLTLQILKG